MHRPHPWTSVMAALVVMAALLPRLASGQCEGRWLEGPEYARTGLGSNVHVRAMTMWDPDGAGPLPERLVVGGSLHSLSGPGFVATWDGSKFVMMPGFFPWATFEYAVRTLAVFNGELIVGCIQDTSDTPSRNVFAWNGSWWRHLALGTTMNVYAMTVAHGCLYVGGFLSLSGSTPAAFHIARWNGTTWTGVTPPFMTNIVIALTTAANGDVIAGGHTWGVARFNGTAWTRLATSVNSRVRSLLELPDGSIIAGGLFTDIDGVPANNIARYHGGAWHPLGAGSTASVRGMAYYNGAAIAAMGVETAYGRHAFQIGAWTPAAGWQPVGEPLGGAFDELSAEDHGPYAMLAHGGRVYIGGGFDTAGLHAAQRLAVLDGDDWSHTSTGFNGDILGFLEYAGDVVAFGRFSVAPGNVAASRVARWDGAAWHPFGAGLNGPVAYATIGNNGLIVAGDFAASGGSPVGRIARWTGEAWAAIGNMDPSVTGPIAVVGSDVYARSGEQIRRWNASTHTWDVLPPVIAMYSGFPHIVTLNAILSHDGLLYAGGDYVQSVGSSWRHSVLARWTGNTWDTVFDQSPGSTLSPLSILRLWSLPNFSVVYTGSGTVFGRFQTGEPMPLAQPPFFTTESGYHVLSSISLDHAGRLVAAGTCQHYTWPTNHGQVPLNNIAFHENGGWDAMNGGRSVTGATLGRMRDVFTNSGPVGDDVGITWTWSRWTHDNIPWIAHQPADAQAPCGEPTTLAVTPASGYGDLTYAWQVADPASPGGWRTLADGPLEVLGDIVGAAAGTDTPALALTPALNFGPIAFRGVIANACGQAASEPATVWASTCPNTCNADVNCDGVLSAADVEAQERAVGGDLAGYCRTNPDFTRDYAVDGFDVEAVALVVGGGDCP